MRTAIALPSRKRRLFPFLGEPGVVRECPAREILSCASLSLFTEIQFI